MKLVPVMVTLVPTVPDVGVKEVIVGTCAEAVCSSNKKVSKRKDCNTYFFIVGFVGVWKKNWR